MKARRHERGIALVIVLWVGLLIAAIAGAFIVDSGNSARLARNFVDNAEARALADGGIHLAIYEVLRPNPEESWRRDGRRYRRDVPGGTLEIAVEDEAGKIDLNNSNEELLLGLFRAAGVEEDRAEVLAQAIEDIRKGKETRDKQGRSMGQPARRTKTRGRSRNRPAAPDADDRPFKSIDSLGQLPGMAPDLYALLRPALTVYGDSKMHYQASPREALLAVPGVGLDAVDTFIQARTEDDSDEPLAAFLTQGQARAYWRRRGSDFLTVKVLAKSANGAKFVRTAIVELAAGENPPFFVREWREGDMLPLWRGEPAPSDTGDLAGGST